MVTATPPRRRLRDVVPGIDLGVWPTGAKNSLTDVPGVLVHTQEIVDAARGVHTGVTTILPRHNWYESGCYAGIFRFNGAGELTGSHFVEEMGKVASPIVVTNTTAVGAAWQGVVEYMAAHHGDADVGIGYFTMPVVAETFDGFLNNSVAFAVQPSHVRHGIAAATSAAVPEGNRGGGTGMVSLGHKGGTGSSSRVVEGVAKDTRYTVAALVQANFGSLRNLRIVGVPYGKIVAAERAAATPTPPPLEADRAKAERDGSIIVVLATDAPLHPRQCERLAKRATVGLARVGGYGQNPSGDIFLAFSTANHVPVQKFNKEPPTDPFKPLVHSVNVVADESINGLLEAAADATEEAIYNALCMAETLTGFKGHTVEALDLDKVKATLDKFMVK
ncbi:D-aminopeptidase [Sporothrix schenckii 1099-18]|uniref:D-aminopeptidase n=1 Tax=Sporothrix schenckii 1099-18 TaxID=1397361 RepID=A0A0F2LRW1_SPOSC|nr:D-aminopeptidase [Sporothrix schenckii 1099-18]KJR80247.1 D-aminopeptidase [Sporothrix schenckii 1099-18]